MEIWNWDLFHDWYLQHLNDTTFFSDVTLGYLYYVRHNVRFGVSIKKYDYISGVYGHVLPLNDMYVAIADNDKTHRGTKAIYFITPRQDLNTQFIWGDHYTFLERDQYERFNIQLGSVIDFHKTIQDTTYRRTKTGHLLLTNQNKFFTMSDAGYINLSSFNALKTVYYYNQPRIYEIITNINERKMLRDIFSIAINSNPYKSISTRRKRYLGTGAGFQDDGMEIPKNIDNLFIFELWNDLTKQWNTTVEYSVNDSVKSFGIRSNRKLTSAEFSQVIGRRQKKKIIDFN